MGMPPDGMQMDRINNDGPYSPDNCRWVTRSENCRNRRSSKHLTFNGETLHYMEWAKRTGIRDQTLIQRISRDEMSVSEAMTRPLKQVEREEQRGL
jgi:hypothetical protein